MMITGYCGGSLGEEDIISGYRKANIQLNTFSRWTRNSPTRPRTATPPSHAEPPPPATAAPLQVNPELQLYHPTTPPPHNTSTPPPRTSPTCRPNTLLSQISYGLPIACLATANCAFRTPLKTSTRLPISQTTYPLFRFVRPYYHSTHPPPPPYPTNTQF